MAASTPETVQSLQSRAISKYKEQFGGTATVAGIAPGRVNIIGEHTDYNDGFVFPMVRHLYTNATKSIFTFIPL